MRPLWTSPALLQSCLGSYLKRVSSVSRTKQGRVLQRAVHALQLVQRFELLKLLLYSSCEDAYKAW